ncbi:metallophosphoesterase 1 [Planococcus citri]|uniref:metallophosphoesterase 1 n=1 Tax=Planococcus citri TaxID=170843 RepID=UPI0031F9B2C1
MYFLFTLPAVLFIFVVLFCEYFIYYIVLYQCSWPILKKPLENGTLVQVPDEDVLRVALIADVHLLGTRKGHWFDKLRREWQMYMSFQALLELHDPEVVFILGDIFDEGSFSPDEVYSTYVKRFFHLFRTNNRTELYVVAGNHDIGFHYAMHPYLEHRFSTTFKAPSVQLLTKKNVHFVLINSMALEKDGCHMCNKAEAQIKYIGSRFKCTNGTGKCYQGMQLKSYSRPVLLQHFPLYRESDAVCNETDEAPYPEKIQKFKEKWDCLSQEATDFLLNILYPRVVFGGHTHHGCHVIHKRDIHEYTIPSFNWRNKPNPSFSMALFTPDQYVISKCHMPNEYFVIGLYIITVIFNVLFFYHAPKFYVKKLEAKIKKQK